MPAIRTHYIGPANRLGSRIKAVAHGAKRVSLTLSWDDALNPSLNHLAAAWALAEREGWSGAWKVLSDTDGGSLFVRQEELHVAFNV